MIVESLPPVRERAMAHQTKRCPRCGETKGRSEFYVVVWHDRRYGMDVERPKLSTYCCVCTQKDTHERDKTPTRRAYDKAWKKRRRDAQRAAREAAGQPVWVRGIWTCAGCNERKPHADFPARGRVCFACQKPSPTPEERRARRLEQMRAYNRTYYAAHRAAREEAQR